MEEKIKVGCEKCKTPKEIELKTENYTREEMDAAMLLVDKYNLTRDQQSYLVNLNNRVNKDNKRLGCGKCFVQVIKNLKNAYKRLYND
jgi:hypothetical protein